MIVIFHISLNVSKGHEKTTIAICLYTENKCPVKPIKILP